VNELMRLLLRMTYQKHACRRRATAFIGAAYVK
jgi:hypothetical protein